MTSITSQREGEEPVTKTLRIPDEPRFVRAFALAVDPGDALGLLMEIGALGSRISECFSSTACIAQPQI
jgi:hypothetical protein